MRSLGYAFTRRIARTAWMELVPESVITLAPCLAPFVPDGWAIAWWGDDDRRASARAAGVPEAAIDDTIRWVTARIDPGPIGVTRSVSTLGLARELGHVAQLGGDAWLVGLAIADDDVARLVDALAPSRPDEGEPGECYVARMALAPEPGESLGWDIACFDHGLAHSYPCNHLATPIRDALGHTPNEHGLYANADAAREIADWIARDEVGAEPGAWLAVEVIRHPWSGPEVCGAR